MDSTLAKLPVREKVAQELYNVLTMTYDSQQKTFTAKNFASLEDHKKLHKFKEKVVYEDGDTVAIGNDLWEFIKTNFKAENFTAQSTDAIIALSDMLDVCDKQDEEKAEAAWKESKDKVTTFQEYYESLGYKVTVTEKE